MSAYVLVDCKVIDPVQYEEYKRLAKPAVELYGGRYLARGGETMVLEGRWQPNRVVVMEFPSLQDVRKFYDSPEYRAARAAREGAADMNLVAVAGA